MMLQTGFVNVERPAIPGMGTGDGQGTIGNIIMDIPLGMWRQKEKMGTIADFLKVLVEAIDLWKSIEEKINEGENKKQNKKLLKACKKALKSGKDKDLAAVRKHLYIANWK